MISMFGNPPRRTMTAIARRPLWIAASALFLAPAVAMLLTQEVAWGPGDFALFGGMLLAVCGAYEFAVRFSAHRSYHLGVALTAVGMFLLVFVNLAVGIIGGEDNPANLAFFAIPLVGLIGAALTRARALGLARTLTVMAAMQVAAAFLAPASEWAPMLIGTAVFVALWTAAAQAFRSAARAEP